MSGKQSVVDYLDGKHPHVGEENHSVRCPVCQEPVRMGLPWSAAVVAVCERGKQAAWVAGAGRELQGYKRREHACTEDHAFDVYFRM